MSDRLMSQQFLDHARLSRRCSSTDGAAGSEASTVLVDRLADDALANNAYTASVATWIKDEPWQESLVWEPTIQLRAGTSVPVAPPAKSISNVGVSSDGKDWYLEQQRQRPGLPIFTTKGAWVRPSSISHNVSSVHRHNRVPPVEAQDGRIDSSASVDIGHAILALDFIDRINDEVLHHYLPAVDATISKEFDLEHQNERLAIRTPSSPSKITVELWDENKGRLDGKDLHNVACDEAFMRVVDIPQRADEQPIEDSLYLAHQGKTIQMESSNINSKDQLVDESSVRCAHEHPLDCGMDPTFPKSLRQRCVLSRASYTSTNEGSVGKPMTPSSCFESETVDRQSPDINIVDPSSKVVSPEYELGLLSIEGERQESQNLPPSTLKAGLDLPLILSENPTSKMPEQSRDPATLRASMRAVYMPGGGRVRREGQYRLEQARLRRLKNRKKIYAQQHAQARSEMRKNHARNLSVNGNGTSASMDRNENSRPIVISVSREVSADSQTISKSIASPSPSSSPCRQGLHSGETSNGGTDEELELSRECVNFQGDPSAKNYLYEENESCPFSHTNLQSSVAVTLRCGHRFALAELGIARRGPSICASAGFAVDDALICPLCGDQDINTMPPPGEMLTCFSKNTDAYLGELRKDWQKPLTMPFQNPLDFKDVGRRPGTGNKRQSLPSLTAQ